MKYTIKPAPAPFVSVKSEAFPISYGDRSEDYVYISEAQPIQNTNPNGIEFDVLPESVKEKLKEYFDTLFNIPVGSRKGYLEQLVPIVIDV